jgi:hypothetical protein
MPPSISRRLSAEPVLGDVISPEGNCHYSRDRLGKRERCVWVSWEKFVIPVKGAAACLIFRLVESSQFFKNWEVSHSVKSVAKMFFSSSSERIPPLDQSNH